jgi:hypothetical protein
LWAIVARLPGSSCRWNEMALQLPGSLTVTFSVAGPIITVVMRAKPWASLENGATRRTFGVLPSPPGSQKKAIQVYWPPREGDGAELLVVLDLHVFFSLDGT